MKRLMYLMLSIISGVIAIFSFLCALASCSTPNNREEYYTKIYPVTSYEIGSKFFKATFTLEDGSEGGLEANTDRIRFHDGEDILVVITYDKDSIGTLGSRAFYLYLNAENAIETLTTTTDFVIENGG